jgi:hypothetical protein
MERKINTAGKISTRSGLNGTGSIIPVLPADYFFRLEANDAVAGATTITSNGKAWTCSAITKAANVQNGLPALDLQSNRLKRLETFTIGAAGVTVFAVKKVITGRSITSNSRIVSQRAQGGTNDYTPAKFIAMQINSPFTRWTSMINGTWDISVASDKIDTTSLLTCCVDSVGLTNYVNGIASYRSDGYTINQIFDLLTIGGTATTGSETDGGFNNYVLEVVYYLRALTTSELAQAHAFLKFKYDL